MSSDRGVGLPATRSPVVIAGFIVVLAAATILGAWGFELAGYVPCELCLKERVPFYAGVPLAALVMALALRRRAGLLQAGFAALVLIFAAGTGLAIYHAGVEWGFWPGPASCSGSFTAPAQVGDFLHQLQTTSVVRCDAAALRILGLSLAGWDAVVSAVLALAAAWGAGQDSR